MFPVPGIIAGGVPKGGSLFELWGLEVPGMSILYGILVGSGRIDFRAFHALSGCCIGTEHLVGNFCRFRNAPSSSFAGTNLFEGNGLVLLLGVCITLAGIAIIGYAGSLRAQNMSEKKSALL